MLQICCNGAIRALWLPSPRRPAAALNVAATSRCAATRFYYAAKTRNNEQQVHAPLRKQLKDEIKAGRSGQGSASKADSPESQLRLRDWELTVGIEIHAQLNTTRKLFSAASTAPTEAPNSHVARFDLSVPGTLPKFQQATLVPALRAAIALGCTIQPVSRFDRKHYFYHDQPAGYQITQYYEPFAKNGQVLLTTNDGLPTGPVTVGIKQVQMEQDTARTQELDESTNMVDYNRAGLPLIEIISLPHIHSPEEASAYVRKVQALLLAVGAVTTGMEMGGLRADVNISVRRRDAEPGQHSYSGVSGLGQRTEIKNLSTLKGVEDAIKAERDRQIDVLRAGGTIEGETRGWSLNKPGETRRLRGKEGEVDYRYLPDADLAPVRISPEVVDYITTTLPTRPDDLLAMLTDEQSYGLTPTDARILLSIDSGERLQFFQEVVEQLASLYTPDLAQPTISPPWGRMAANWVLQELGSLMAIREKPWADHKVSVTDMAGLIHLLLIGNVTSSTAKQVLKMLFLGDARGVGNIIEAEGLEFKPLSEDAYAELAAEIIKANPGPVKDIREKGKSGKLMFLVGQMMRKGEDGRIEAKKAEEILRRLVLTP